MLFQAWRLHCSGRGKKPTGEQRVLIGTGGQTPGLKRQTKKSLQGRRPVRGKPPPKGVVKLSVAKAVNVSPLNKVK